MEVDMAKHKSIILILLAAILAIPGIYFRLAGIHLDPIITVLIAGAAVMGASFLLLWACDAAQSDISQTLALAIVALVAVLPEYAVDMYFTWMAGQHPQSNYAHYAIANMTGANRLIIGVAWAVVAAIYWIRTRKAVQLEKDRRIELSFLGMATLYAFVITIKGSLAWYDGIIFIGMYVWYISLASKRPCTESEIEGPAHAILALPVRQRRIATISMFLYAAGAILANAEPFCEGLIGTGKALHINEFLLVQWLAPIASEMPEFVVAIVFAFRKQAGLALGSLLSAKVNQWSLLVGMIPGVYAVSAKTISHPIPMNTFQMHEILLTAAQSLLAVIILASRRLTIGNALLLFILFAGQLLAPTLVGMLPGGTLLGLRGDQMHQLFIAFYLITALAIYLDRPQRMKGFLLGFRNQHEKKCLDQGHHE